MSSPVIKSIGELVARGFKICLIIDSSCIEFDKQWL